MHPVFFLIPPLKSYMYIFWKIDYFCKHFQVHSKVECKVESRISLLQPPPAFSVISIPQQNGSFSVTDELAWTHQSPKACSFHSVTLGDVCCVAFGRLGKDASPAS